MIPQPRTGPLNVAIEPAPEAHEWDALSERAPHPHYGRQAIEAHRAGGMAPADLRFVTVRDRGRLSALLPFRLQRDASALGGRVARPFLSPFVTATPPLVSEPRPTVLDALVEGLALASGGRGWRWPLLPQDETARGMLDAMARAGWSVGVAERFERPVLQRRASHDAFLASHPHKSRLKDLRRRERRLAEAGTVAFETASGGAAHSSALEAFLSLERAGWKGEAGTALACRPETAAFARALFRDTLGPVRPRADTLSLDGRPIAISLALVCGGTATLLKTAYDESFRALAPGLLLEAAIVRALHETGFADRLDSATLPGSALESLYPERETICEIVAVPPGAKGPSLETRLRLVRFEASARTEAKRLMRRGATAG